MGFAPFKFPFCFIKCFQFYRKANGRVEVYRSCLFYLNTHNNKKYGRNSRGNARRVSIRKYKRNSSSLYLGSNTVNSEAGLYVDLLINGTPAKFLIDTGATIFGYLVLKTHS
jgi:hypothetical protein